tara:strand:+ start:3589 stop:4131 length:543 start_codon:yes stop_codon:yes gene_type:complete
MPNTHWLEAFETNRGNNAREDLTWQVFEYGGWTVEVAGVKSTDVWTEGEAVYTKKYHSSFIHRYHEVRGTYGSLYALLSHIEREAKIKRPEDPGCEHKGFTVKTALASLPVPSTIKDAVKLRLSIGENKYGTELTIGWKKALQYLEEEEDDMIAYCLAADKKLYAVMLSWVIWVRRKLHV